MPCARRHGENCTQTGKLRMAPPMPLLELRSTPHPRLGPLPAHCLHMGRGAALLVCGGEDGIGCSCIETGISCLACVGWKRRGGGAAFVPGKEQTHVSVQPAGAHTQQKHMCTQAHARSPSQVHAVKTSPPSLLPLSPLDNPSLAQVCFQPILCWHPTCWQLVRRCISSLVHLWEIMDGSPRHWGSVAMVG